MIYLKSLKYKLEFTVFIILALFVWNVIVYKNDVDKAATLLYNDLRYWTYDSTSHRDHSLFNALRYCYINSIPEVFDSDNVEDIQDKGWFFTRIRQDQVILKTFQLKEECLNYMEKAISEEGDLKNTDLYEFFNFKKHLGHSLRYRT